MKAVHDGFREAFPTPSTPSIGRSDETHRHSRIPPGCDIARITAIPRRATGKES